VISAKVIFHNREGASSYHDLGEHWFALLPLHNDQVALPVEGVMQRFRVATIRHFPAQRANGQTAIEIIVD